MNRNCVCADIWRQAAEALRVRVVQRRVHLVEQAEGAGFSLKSENTSAIAVSLFPPETADRLRLCSGLREHLQPRVEDLFAREPQARPPAAEGAGTSPKLALTASKAVLQQLAVAVDALDGRFERLHRLDEVRGLHRGALRSAAVVSLASAA
jgi:hypothetical protein